MKKLITNILLVASILCFTQNISADETANVSVKAGYVSNYLVNGVSRTDGSSFVGVDASKTTQVGNVYVSGLLLPNSGLDESHWTFGIDKAILKVATLGDLSVGANVTRHQAGNVGIRSSTEFGARVVLNNKYIVPYARGSYDGELDQYGWFVGVYRVQPLFFGVTATPKLEYGELSDYTNIQASITLSRPIETIEPLGEVTPFVEVAWNDNNFDVQNYNFATQELDGEVSVIAGVQVTF